MSEWKPLCVLSIAGGPSTATVNDRLVSAIVTDEPGTTSDSLVLTFDDRKPRIATPEKGVEITVAMGFGSAVPLGVFTVDVVGASSPPATMTIRAKPKSQKESVKQVKTREWHQKTLGQIIGGIAGEHGLSASISPALASHYYPNLAQVAESDQNLMTRLAREHGATGKFKDGKLMFHVRASQDEGGGVVALVEEDFAEWDFESEDRPVFRQCICWWRDYDKGKREKVVVGGGEPSTELRHTYPTKAKAIAAGTARLNTAARLAATFNGELKRGNPALKAEGRISVSDLRPGANGLWSLVRVTHTFDQNGYHTRFDAETPT